MAFIPIYLKSNHIDVHLDTDDKEIHNLINEILNEIITIKKSTFEKYPEKKKIRYTNYSRKALKKVLLNLIRDIKTKESIRISRDRNHYRDHRMYGKHWYKYKWLVEIVVDGLIELGYVENIKGCWNKEKECGRRSKIWASDRLLSKLKSAQKKPFYRTVPEQIIQLKDADKNLIDFLWYKPRLKMKIRLEQYNNFIQEQFITVNLTEAVWIDNEFLINNLLRGLLNKKYSLSELKLNKEIIPVNANVDKSSSNPRYILYKHITSKSYSNTTTNTYSSKSINTSSILNPNIINSTLTSHILTLIHLSSTQIFSPRHTLNKAIMNSNEQLLDYFLNWLYFLNRDIRRSKTNEETKWLFRKKRSLEQLGISELIFRLTYQSLHRVFNDKSFKRGGRFYGAAHLDIPGHMRSFIRINGEPVIELDYDALHIFMLYHLRKIDIDIEQDPYDKIEGPEDRTIKKTVLLIAINAKEDALAVKGIRKKLVDDGIKGDVLTDKSLKSLLSRAKMAHPDIAEDIASGKGVILQNTDSKIADAILTNFMEMGVPALCVHDSFIVPAQYEDELRRQMVEEYEKNMKFKPGVSKKEKRYEPKKCKFYR